MTETEDMDLPWAPVDKGLDVRAYFDAKTRDYLVRVITPEVIEEHCRNPHAQHRSEGLARLMFYFKNLPKEEQYALRVMPDGTYRITDFPRGRQRPSVLDNTVYATPQGGLHGIFLRKIKDLMDKTNG